MLKLKSFLFLLALSSGVFRSQAQDNLNPVVVEYVKTYADLAIAEMQRTGVPAAIKLAQGILETEAGQSDLVRRSNNHFGIKCKSWWTGEKVYHDDDEAGECFRKYPEAYQSWKDHSDYLKSQPRYAFLFQLDPEDYSGWAKGLKKAGYATNPKYPQILIKYIELYHLDDYTLIAIGKKKPATEFLAGVYPDRKIVPVTTGSGQVVTNSAGNAIETVNSAASTVPELQPQNYPEGEFRINDTRVIFASAGSSLLAIADNYRVKLKWLYEFNELDQNTEVLDKSQLVYLQRKRKHGFNEFHICRAGETLADISQSEGIRLESLLSYNFLEAQMIPAAGEKLYLKYEAPARPRLASAGQANIKESVAANNTKPMITVEESYYRHTVSSKETLYSLSKKYQVSQEQIRDWNKLDSVDLRVGQELLIYKSR
ncbi:glucosaminidase domain-containing protein [Pollutibacter soli]|uniref:glucosaminidase domain-containing protein n=1 Tax=Pollutibacter soli TaxID=3034157 RepID=UPI003013BDF9